MNPKGYLYLGLLLAGAGVAVFVVLRKRKTDNFLRDAIPLDAGDPGGTALTGHTVEINRVGLDSVTAEVEIVNPTTRDLSGTVKFQAIPSGGFEFGLDPFEGTQRVTVPARSKVSITFSNQDWAFAPFSTWKATLSIDGFVVDQA